MGRQVYVYQGQEYSLPDSLSPEEALGKIKSHLGVVDQPKGKTSFVEDLKTGTAGAMNTLDTVGTLAVYANMRALAEGDQVLPGIADGLNARIAERNKWANPEGKEQGIGGAVISAIPQFLTAPLSPAETAKNAKESGESYLRSVGIGAIDAAGNALGLVIPAIPSKIAGKLLPNVNKQLAEKSVQILGGAASNAAQEYATRKLEQQVAQTDRMQQMLEPTGESLAAAALLGGGLGAFHDGPKEQTKSKYTSDRINKLEKLDAASDFENLAQAEAKRRWEQQRDQMLAEAKQSKINQENPTITVDNSGRAMMPDDLQVQRIFEAQKSIDERNANQDLEVAKQTSLDMNAAERKRQSEAPTGFTEYDQARTTKLQTEVEQLQQHIQSLAEQKQVLEENQASRHEQENSSRRQAEAQHVLEERQAQLEFEVKRQQSLDFNAAERARQESQPILEKSKELGMPQSEELAPTPSVNAQPLRVNVPRSQRGGINFDEIYKSLGGAKNTLSNVFNKLPGASEVGKMLEHVYPDVNKLKQQIIDAGVNSKILAQRLQSGSSLVYIKTKDPLIRAVSTIMQTAAKRAERNIQTFVKPLEHSLQQLRKADPQAFIDLGEVFKREMLNRKTYTPEQLQAAGFTPEQVKLYSQMRDLYDKSYEVQNKVLEQQDRPSLTKQEYYMASRWEGDWGTNLYGKDGKLLWVIRGMTKGEVEAGMKHLKESGIDFDEAKAKPTYTRKDHSKWADYPAAYAAMIQHLSETNPMSKAAREAYESMSADEIFKSLGQNRHFLEKANIRGFAGDRPWKDRLTDATDMFHQQLQYNMNAFEWSEMQSAGKMAHDILSDETIQKQSPDSVDYSKNVIDRYTGGGDHRLLSKMENSVAKSLGRSTQDLRNVTSGLKSLWIMQKMAGSMKNVFIQNPLQFMNSLAWHTDLSTQGIKHNAFKTFANSAVDTLAGLSQHYGDMLGLKGVPSPSKLGQEAINYARSNGILEMSVFDEHTDLRTPEWQRKAQKTLGRPQIESDKLSRFAAFMGYVHHLAQSGKITDKAELFREAEHYTRGSMVDTSRQERPFIVQDTGILGNLGSGLQSFNVNYLNQFAGLANKARKGNVAPLAVFLATSAAMSGLSGVTGFNWMGDLYDKLRDNSETAYAELPDFRKILLDLEGDGSFWGVAKSRGLPAAVTGLDVGKAFESSLPQVPVVGMAGDILGQAADVGSALSEGDLTKAAYAVAPSGLPKGMMEVHSDLFKSPFSDKYTDSKGNIERGIFRDDKMKLFKSLGLPTVAEAHEKDVIYASEKDKQNNAKATRYFSNQIIKAWGQGKNPELAISRLAKINPEALNQLQANSETYIKNSNLDYRAIQADKAKNSTSARRLKDYGAE